MPTPPSAGTRPVRAAADTHRPIPAGGWAGAGTRRRMAMPLHPLLAFLPRCRRSSIPSQTRQQRLRQRRSLWQLRQTGRPSVRAQRRPDQQRLLPLSVLLFHAAPLVARLAWTWPRRRRLPMEADETWTAWAGLTGCSAARRPRRGQSQWCHCGRATSWSGQRSGDRGRGATAIRGDTKGSRQRGRVRCALVAVEPCAVPRDSRRQSHTTGQEDSRSRC